MSVKYGKLPHEILLQPYGLFIINLYVYVVGKTETRKAILDGADNELDVIMRKLLEM